LSLNSQTGEINPNDSEIGTYLITNTIEASGTCPDANSTFLVTIIGTSIDFPAIPTVCESTGVFSLVATPTGGTFSGNGVVNTSNLDTSSALGSNNVTYTLVDANNCVNTASQTISVVTNAIVTFDALSSVCVYEEQFEITQVSPAGGTFSGNGMSSPTIFNPSIAGIGTHTIIYSVTQNGCTNSASQTIEVEACASINEQTFNFSVYPNPSNGMIVVKSNEVISVSIYSLDGRKIIDKQYITPQNQQIDCSNFAKGQYLMILSNENSSLIEKILIE
jgi:hypothetical protein